MKIHKFFLIFLIGSFLFLPLFLATPARAILGDVDGDGFVLVGDAVYLIAYLKGEGPPPVVRNDADCDNCPGITIGDALQIIGYAVGGQQLFPPVGTDLVVPSGIEIITPWVDGNLGQIVTEDVTINTVDQPDLYALVIPLSYQHLPDQTELECTAVDFTGTLLEGQGAGYIIDNLNKKVLIIVSQPTTVVIPSGSDGAIAHLTFEVLVEGDPTKLTVTHFPPENTILLISEPYYGAGDPPGRMLLPKFDLSVVCDANGDGRITISDVVYLINFMFRNGPPPLDF
jgi:hypothetical protein